MQLIENLIDWAIEDVDLLSIRARGSHMRRLDLDDGSRRKWETINAILMLLMLGIVGGVSVFRRKTLPDARFAGGGSSKPHSPDDEQDDEDAEHDGDDEDAIGEEE